MNVRRKVLSVVSAVLGLTALLQGCEASEEATILDPSSPYYDRPCPLVQHQEHKSALIADCRCGPNKVLTSGIPICLRPYELRKKGGSVGEGPSYADLYEASYLGGELDESLGPEGTLWLAMSFGGSSDRRGAIVALDVASGDRRVVSGETPDGATVGAGPSFGSVLDVRRAPGGLLYAWTRGAMPNSQVIVSVDPASGDRTVVWRAGDDAYPQCADQHADKGFAVDGQGRVYLSAWRGAIGRLTAGFEACEPFSTSETLANGFIQGFSIANGKLYGMTTAGKHFFEIDLETREGTLIVSFGGAMQYGERWPIWDAARGVFWMAGLMNTTTVAAFEPTTGRAALIHDGGGVFPWMPLGAGGPAQINALNYAPVFLHSNGHLFLAIDGMAMAEFEPSTGNSIVHSL